MRRFISIGFVLLCVAILSSFRALPLERGALSREQFRDD